MGKTPGFIQVQLRKKQGVGFGIAISGGSDNQIPGESSAITISDVVDKGPAVGKLEVGDKLIMVQDQSCVGMSRAECVQLMKAAGNTMTISIVRQTTRNPVSNMSNMNNMNTMNSRVQNNNTMQSGNPYNNRNLHHQREVQRQQELNNYSQSKSDYNSEEDEPDYILKQPLNDINEPNMHNMNNNRQQYNPNTHQNTPSNSVQKRKKTFTY